jgi:hypothetical protein
MFEGSAKQMTWHKHGHRYHPNKMVHPSDGEAWKDFDMEYKDFAREARNVRVAIAIDGFNPFGMGPDLFLSFLSISHLVFACKDRIFCYL